MEVFDSGVVAVSGMMFIAGIFFSSLIVPESYFFLSSLFSISLNRLFMRPIMMGMINANARILQVMPASSRPMRNIII